MNRSTALFRTFIATATAFACSVAAVSAAPTTAYPQPAPSNDEQYMLELINAARANSTAEGQMLANIKDATILQYYSHYNVNTSQMAAQFATYTDRMPLSMNAELMVSSREQSVDQATHGFQGHDGTDGSTFDGRITAQGYAWAACGENVYAYSKDAFFSHVAFQADWGVPSLDHRENIMNTDTAYPIYREIGISCVASSVSGYGPMVVTQDFGTPQNGGTAFLVGVVYGDANSNGAYDQGEGLGNVTIMPDSGSYYAVTATSGGFVIPLPATGSGTITLTASGGGLGGPRVKTVQYTAGVNVKVDFTTADPVASLLPVVTMSAPSKDARTSTGQTGEITITRTGSTESPLTVALWFGGTAVNGTDCNMVPSSLTIPAGSAAINYDITATNPGLNTVAKFKIHLGEGTTYSLGVDDTKNRIRIHGDNN